MTYAVDLVAEVKLMQISGIGYAAVTAGTFGPAYAAAAGGARIGVGSALHASYPLPAWAWADMR